jgi:hypothetical protein
VLSVVVVVSGKNESMTDLNQAMSGKDTNLDNFFAAVIICNFFQEYIMDYFRRIQYEHYYVVRQEDEKGLAKKKRILRRWARRFLKRVLRQEVKECLS